MRLFVVSTYFIIGFASLALIHAAPSSAYDSSDPRWIKWREQTKSDPKFEWKTPIAFYGRVLDQDSQPVQAAKVTLSWTDLSPKGVSLRDVTTDQNGNFSLTKVRGKHLLIRSITKDGYNYANTNRDGFEYAAFFDEEYYQPKVDDPVIFKMQKMRPDGRLTKISGEFDLSKQNTASIPLIPRQEGKPSAACLIEITDNSDPTGKRWKAQVSVPNGEIQICNAEFPTEAPDSGYTKKVILNQDSPQPSAFQSGSLYKGGRSYLKTSSGFAVLEFRMIPGNKYIRVVSYFNPLDRKLVTQFGGGKSKP
jgi:hypothetical protein